ncbi:MAG: haloacid dehalogenase type II [Geminicoccaceae bacterium]
MVDAVVFDAYGTLFDLASALRGEEQALGDRGRQLGELWRRKQLEYTWVRSLAGQHADFWQVTGDSLDYALEALGLADPARRDRLLAAYRTLRPYPEVAEVLAALDAGGLRLAILSNGEPGMLRAAIEAGGLAGRFARVLSVEDVGVYKPAPAVYALACGELDLPPRRIAFVSANGWDGYGAAAFGLRVFRIDRTGAPAERLPAAPEAVLPDLRPLPGLLLG